MNHSPMQQPQSPEDILKQLIDACDCSSQRFLGQEIDAKAALTELMPDIRSRNWQRARNSIDCKRDRLIGQIEQQINTPVEIKEHHKNVIRWQAKAFKWLIDGLELEQQRCILFEKA